MVCHAAGEFWAVQSSFWRINMCSLFELFMVTTSSHSRLPLSGVIHGGREPTWRPLIADARRDFAGREVKGGEDVSSS